MVMVKTKVSVAGKTWEVIARSDRSHNKQYPKCHAITELDLKKIYVRKSSLNIITLIHEFVHAYQQELSFYELELDDEQISEWFCELWAKYGEQILKDAKEICLNLEG